MVNVETKEGGGEEKVAIKHYNFRKGWLPIAKLKPLVERYSCQPMRRLDTSNNLSVGPSCM
jgi:hypothetical protein